MPEPASRQAASSLCSHEGAASGPRSADAEALLRECFAQYLPTLVRAIGESLAKTDDLFDASAAASNQDILDFRARRAELPRRFDRAVRALFEARMAGRQRSGRRPDVDTSLDALSVLSEHDYAMQAGLTHAVLELEHAARSDLRALDARVAVLLAEPVRGELDNPFSTDYLLDGIGSSTRAVFPDPRIYRPVMRRVVEDLVATVAQRHFALNRFLADHDVLPEAEATLRARSELRPADDSELLQVFNRLLTGMGTPEPAPPALDGAIEVPDQFDAPGAPSFEFDDRIGGGRSAGAGSRVPGAAGMLAPPSPAVMAAVLEAFARFTASASAAGAASPQPGAAGWIVPVAATRPGMVPATEGETGAATDVVPSNGTVIHGRMLDRSPAPGAPLKPAGDALLMSPVIVALDRWQRFDPNADAAWVGAAPTGSVRPDVPLNRIPIIGAAIADTIVDPMDGVAIEVMALLFDYIFRDPSIPDSMRSIFARLQVPIAKAALLDRAFFSDRAHPARRLLDDLAVAAVGAHGDDEYRAALEAIGQRVVTEVCEEFKTDLAVFTRADAKLQALIAAEQSRTAAALTTEVATALNAEKGDGRRLQIRALVRERFASHEVPFTVRWFAETVWVDYLNDLGTQDGLSSEPCEEAFATLDDLIWSIGGKEQPVDRARLRKLIPPLIGKIKAGFAGVRVDRARETQFFEALYELHLAALRPEAEPAPQASPVAAVVAANDSLAPTDAGTHRFHLDNIQRFVSEMAFGTWMAFEREQSRVDARLFWVSPLRTKYIFTARSLAIVLSAEELAWQLGTGKAVLVVEPVPLFDRAVDNALNMLAANQEYIS